jgi:catechol 2,3-dioxygenase
VGLNTWAAGAPAATDDDARLVHWELILPDAAAVDAALDSLRASGFDVAASSPAGRVGIDPWGVAVRLVAAMAG